MAPARARAQRALSQRPEGNAGGRFSRMAARPSRTSSSMKVSISSAIDWSKIGPAWRSQLLSERFVQRIACYAPRASRSPTSSAFGRT